jgi:NAD(P)H dehydrogenase (quinone)
MTIAVTGGNGEFGRAVLEALVARAQEPIVGTVRDLTKVVPVPGVDYRPGDFDGPTTLRTSLTGIETVLVNATFFGADPAMRLPRVTAALHAAADAGASRIVLTSWPDLENATVPAVQDYKRLESVVRSIVPSWTILRLAYGLADAVARDVAWARAGGVLVAPAAGAVTAPAAVVDLAEATAAVLAAPGSGGLVYEVTGPDRVTWDQVADLAGVTFRSVSDDEYLAYLTRFDLPSTVTRQLLELYADFRGAWTSAPTSTLASLLGRRPIAGIDAVERRVARLSAA